MSHLSVVWENGLVIQSPLFQVDPLLQRAVAVSGPHVEIEVELQVVVHVFLTPHPENSRDDHSLKYAKTMMTAIAIDELGRL